ncbi:hypothetical protein [Thalassococcus lentus]|uniref:Uncharacterized protein n=1 Tax=Thalassococcus lentus TaxID=1210524 RepID=A0ABT4XWY1_9RHOB|nr:hypothetical protein [Thalassococcus lentus]MDA7426459.1 hypothetical protein [Thalassococcus lentus]
MKFVCASALSAMLLATQAQANPVLLAFDASSACRAAVDTSVVYLKSTKKSGANGVRLQFKKVKGSSASNADYRKEKDAFLACIKERLAPHSVEVKSN